MRTLVLVFVVISFIALGSVSAQADEFFECYGDSTIAGEDGWLITITDTDDNAGVTIFVFDEGGYIRLFAEREHGSTTWDIRPTAQYIVPTSSMDVGDSWRFLDGDGGQRTDATVSAIESVTTGAGTFSNAYRVDIRTLGDPTIQERMWWASGVGIVRNEGYIGGPSGTLDWQDDLTSYTHVGGSGFLPLAQDNTWYYTFISVAIGAASVGELKAQYR